MVVDDKKSEGGLERITSIAGALVVETFAWNRAPADLGHGISNYARTHTSI